METFLETLKARLIESTKKMQDAQQRAAIAQSEYQTATQECAGWQKAFEAETRREQQSASKTIVVVDSKKFTIEPAPQLPSDAPEPNKTDLIREVLRQHPAGVTPPDLWKALSGKIVHRPYLYSVLKRLRDKKEVAVRRGKYVLNLVPKNEEEQTVQS